MKIMFICTGNTCRSAMGQALMKKRVKELNKDIEVYSCGIYAAAGESSTNHAIQVMRNYGVDLSSHRAIDIHKSDIKEMDLILCATSSNEKSVLGLYPELKEKVYTIKEYSEYNPNGLDQDINDPYGGSMELYQKCAEELAECIEMILKKL